MSMTQPINTDISHFDEALTNLASQISDEYTEIVKSVTMETSEKVKDAIKSHAPVGARGKYVAHFALKTSYEDKRNLRRTWYVRNPEYRLTHLLEYGHRVNIYPYGNKKAGLHEYGKSRAIPHIKYGEEIASRLPEFIEEALP